MSLTSSPAKSVVTCPGCKRATNIYRHIALGYTKISVYHVVACQLCGVELFVVTVINGMILSHDQLKATLLHPSRPQTSAHSASDVPTDRRTSSSTGRLP
ncbi:MAG: hypothetical protein AAB663_02085 [Patescibacteria group bacterium]